MIGTAAAAALFAGRPALAAPVNVVVLGDSYSQVPRANFPNWVTQLQSPYANDVGTSRNFAKSGATAAKIGTNHFARQLRLWREAGRPLGDRVIVFLGTNDILHTDNFDLSYTGYKRGINELKTAGAKLLLVEPLDLGKTPDYAGDADSAAVTARTVTWNNFVRSRGLPVVRLFDVFKPLLPNSALFQDGIHPNRDGQAIIADAVRARLVA
jgi:lysophospholipase L1-like esterase